MLQKIAWLDEARGLSTVKPLLKWKNKKLMTPSISSSKKFPPPLQLITKSHDPPHILPGPSSGRNNERSQWSHSFLFMLNAFIETSFLYTNYTLCIEKTTACITLCGTYVGMVIFPISQGLICVQSEMHQHYANEAKLYQKFIFRDKSKTSVFATDGICGIF